MINFQKVFNLNQGTLLYIYNYLFDDLSSKNKYFLVLKEINETESILVSLPSSKDYIPSTAKIEHGCIDLSLTAQQTTYCFEKDKIITKDTSFCFPLNTFVYGQYLTSIKISDFTTKYPVEGVHYEKIGILNDVEIDNIINCFKNSNVVKNKYKKLL